MINDISITAAVNYAPTCIKDNGGCSHTCTSLASGRVCSCPPSYTLALDGMKCFLTGNKSDFHCMSVIEPCQQYLHGMA